MKIFIETFWSGQIGSSKRAEFNNCIALRKKKFVLMCLSGSEGNADGVAINLTFFIQRVAELGIRYSIFYYESDALYTAPRNQLTKKKKKKKRHLQFMEPKQMRHYKCLQ